MGFASTAIRLAAALAVLHTAAAITLDVAPYGCTGFQYSVMLDKYNFTSTMNDYTIPTWCNTKHIKCVLFSTVNCMHAKWGSRTSLAKHPLYRLPLLDDLAPCLLPLFWRRRFQERMHACISAHRAMRQ